MEKQQPAARHLRRISAAKRLPALAGNEQICGRSILTGQTKCVDEDSPKRIFIEDIPIP
ncbi:MAG: hypothetical protein WD873_08055 [Candidatus Hydrogenedentales bacterium]